MKVVNIKDLDQFANQEVELKGWVYNIRSIGKIWFVILRDGTGLLQGVVVKGCLLYTSPSPRDNTTSRMPSSA